jgi:hypothetical protein
MPWSDEFAYRDCAWCQTRSVAMRQLTGTLQAPRPGAVHREWTVLVCPRCAGVTLIETQPNNGYASIAAVFPESAVERAQVSHLPDDVERYYRDAIRVLDAGVPDAAAVQLRRTLEAAAAHVGVTEKTLMASIEKLIEGGYITKDFGRVLHHVRKIGNLGAHYTDERLDDEAAQLALRFTTQVLRNLFEVPGELAGLGGPTPPS